MNKKSEVKNILKSVFARGTVFTNGTTQYLQHYSISKALKKIEQLYKKDIKEKVIIGYVTPEHFKEAFKFTKRDVVEPSIRRKRWFKDDVKVRITVERV